MDSIYFPIIVKQFRLRRFSFFEYWWYVKLYWKGTNSLLL